MLDTRIKVSVPLVIVGDHGAPKTGYLRPEGALPTDINKQPIEAQKFAVFQEDPSGAVKVGSFILSELGGSKRFVDFSEIE